MEERVLSPDTQAVLLLCANLGQSNITEPKPLIISEYNSFSLWLHSRGMRPSDMLIPVNIEKLAGFEHERLSAKRILELLERGAALAFAVERWAARGLWVISRCDDAYPTRLKTKLRGSAPPVLYGVGNVDLLDSGGLAIVGSRKVDEDGLAFTRRTASACVSGNIQVISGGAKGVDREAIFTTLAEQGSATVILPDGLAKAAASGKYREALRAGSLCITSPYDPEAGFSVGNAMGRNRYIYSLADYALVISADVEKGGTWAGAVENLKKGLAPLFIRSDDNMPDGNRRLIEMGGIPMDQEALIPESKFGDWLRQAAGSSNKSRNDNLPENDDNGQFHLNLKKKKHIKAIYNQIYLPFYE